MRMSPIPAKFVVIPAAYVKPLIEYCVTNSTAPASTSESLDSTFPEMGEFSSVVPTSTTAKGASFAPPIVMVNCAVEDCPVPLTMV